MSEDCGCDEVREALYALVDCEECDEAEALLGEEAGPDRDARLLLLAHASGCASCADALEAERHLRALLRSCFAEEAPDGLEARLVASLEEAASPSRE